MTFVTIQRTARVDILPTRDVERCKQEHRT